ncbi:hypothetical protein DTO166G4_3520 [Paecilomyces variotii]|uniref:F-box domain protein n=1 Tax=Byssochlamys spectabilis TaxID=264951 RepID=A0A443HSZ6_BYSSP|nr:F-box domain protein [Paecilomyces variotii]KAJ9199804.1 hypothetical protein DTO032I3_4936 [Paecilomyces variotii]KAJ9214928.1 hypothetical protein DTO166G4_3520 [Paecilomyces variotii]KAJ9238392.1 hypothetical protein DTO166G5_2940 [Paecilomyces variotii]KAJ9246150.1 hypothetical protein DTO169E5_274 [Paecilomyces variotii]KAJ9254966.1 hypothetical protein DTO195F2_6450 [Paecilomyces variotii]
MKLEVDDALQKGVTLLGHDKPDLLRNMPMEIMFMILSHLNISSLVSFGETSRANYIYHTLCLKRLHIAVFQKRLHTTIAFIEATSSTTEHSGRWGIDSEHQVSIVLPRSNRGKEVVGHRSPLRGSRWSAETRRRNWERDEENPPSLNHTILSQNEVFANLLSRYGRSLHDLEFMAYDLDARGAVALATHCKWKLRHLALRFEHPYIRDAILSRGYWMKPAPSSTAWNALIGSGSYEKDMGPTGLESLVLERAGITAWQLQMLVKRNPRLKDLRLRTCKAIQLEFLNWLGGIEKDPNEGPNNDSEDAPGSSLQVLWLENSDEISAERIDASEKVVGLEWMVGMKSLKSLSFRDCRRINADIIEKANKEIWHIPEVFLPYPLGPSGGGEGTIEVDPAYM